MTSSPIPSSATPTPISTGGAPGPTQPGQVANCNRWDLVKDGDNCSVYIAKYPGLTLKDLTTWNTGIGDQCQTLWLDTYVSGPLHHPMAELTVLQLCTGVPGFSPITSSTQSVAPSPTNGIATPAPTQPGMVNNCDAFHFVTDGDTCASIASQYGISLSQFSSWNTKTGTNCAGLWLNAYVCVSIIGVSPTSAVPSTTVKPTPSNGISTPTPIQSGMVNNCDAFHLVVSGDECGLIASKYGISLTQFYAWNPAVGSSCATLGLDYYVCVSIVGMGPTSAVPSTTVKPTPSNGIATPTPIQSGMVNNCDAFHKVVSGDQCGLIASKYGISLSQFYSWNPAVGSSCATLGLDYYVCVSIVGVAPSPTTLKTSTTTTKGNGVSTPTPVQSGITSSCKTFRKVVTGDTCAVITQKAGISLANFYKWNPGVGSSCQTLQLDTYVCVAVL